MKPHEKGWLKDHIEFRQELLKDTIIGGNKASHPEQSLYRIIQPTGLMYGQAIPVSNYPNSEKWSKKERMKILLADSLISSSLLFYDKQITTSKEISEIILKTLDSIASFYNTIFPELSTPAKSLFGRRKTPLEIAEKILDKRIHFTDGLKNNFWLEFFHNSLLFLDVFIFGQWIHTNADRIVSDFFKYEREELRFSVVKVIAAAAHANQVVEFEERRLLEYFLQSANLSTEKRKESIRIFDEGIEVEEINLPTNNSWILKKYFLEMAILTLWADKKVDGNEQEFLKRLCSHMRFTEDDLENSMMAVEAFVLENWDQLNYLQNKQDYDLVSERFIKRLSRITVNYRNKLLREVRQNRELMMLIKKIKLDELSEREKKQMQDFLIAALKTIPTFVTIALPQRFLTLNVLMKILPADFFAEI